MPENPVLAVDYNEAKGQGWDQYEKKTMALEGERGRKGKEEKRNSNSWNLLY